MRNPITIKEFIIKATLIHLNKYTYNKLFLKNKRYWCELKCNTCGNIFEQRTDSHLTGNGCPNCRNKYFSEIKTISQEEIIKRFMEIHNNNYDYSKTITNGIHNKVCIICPMHGEFWQTPNNHLKGHGCPICRHINQAISITLDQEEVLKRFIDIHGDRYGYDDFIYKGFHEKGLIECYQHGLFPQTPNNHLKGQGCPGCKRSKGEKYIETILKKLNVKFIQEYKIQGYNFEYDFYLPDYKTFIEFNGRQHYEPVEIFGGIEGFKVTVRNDAFKKELVRLLGEKLLIFTYRQLNFKQLEILLTTYILSVPSI